MGLHMRNSSSSLQAYIMASVRVRGWLVGRVRESPARVLSLRTAAPRCRLTRGECAAARCVPHGPRIHVGSRLSSMDRTVLAMRCAVEHDGWVPTRIAAHALGAGLPARSRLSSWIEVGSDTVSDIRNYHATISWRHVRQPSHCGAQRHATFTTGGGTHEPSTMAALGAYRRMVTPSGPLAGAGSQLASLSGPGLSGWM